MGLVQRIAARVDARRRDTPERTQLARHSDGSLAVEDGTVSSLLFTRLSDTEIEAIESRLGEEQEPRTLFVGARSERIKRFLLLAYGVWFDVPGVSRKTGLTSVQPPEDVHAMARGPLAAAGGLDEADLVVDALASGGTDIGEVHAALDFGCSSGRVARVLAAAYPDIELHACDPNAPAIDWAREHLDGIEFFVSGEAPPLPLGSASLDLAYAISIWSHFAPPLGLRWFEEMSRLLRPGGHLVCTTHGYTSIAHYAEQGLRSATQSREIRDAMYGRGWWYAPEFGEAGDWGVTNPEWGTTFLAPEWLLAQLCPRWRVVEFAPGRNQGNQDVYVLQRA